MIGPSTRHPGRVLLALGATSLIVSATTLFVGTLPVGAAQETVGLGNAASYAVLGGSEVTNENTSIINGDLGVSPGTAVTGFPPGIVNGTIYTAGEAAPAQSDATTAYNDAAGRTPFTTVVTELGDRTFMPGVYRNSTLGLTNTVTLDAAGDPNAVFIFQSDSTLITASGSRVRVINGAQACNVFWQVGSSATLGTTTEFVGTILALASITANNNANVQGRLLARDGAVTLNDNTITAAACEPGDTTTSTTTATTATDTDPTAGTDDSTRGADAHAAGSRGSGDASRTALRGGPADASSTPVDELANTDSRLTWTSAVAGAMAILLGALMLSWSKATERGGRAGPG